MRQRITRLNVLDMGLVLLFFEGATLLVLGLLAWTGPVVPGSGVQESIVLGSLVGIVGTVIALALWQGLGFCIRGAFRRQLFTVTGIALAPACAANAVFLSVLFIIQGIIARLETVQIFGTALLGFAATALAFVILIALYNILPLKLALVIDGSPITLRRASPLRIALIAGIYEAIILPIMVFALTLPLPIVPRHVLAGISSGFLGGIIGTWLFNRIATTLTPWIDLR